MKERLLSLLGIETGEESMVTMLLMQSVFLGIFFGTFDISAHSLFLSEFDEKMMARAYVVSGLAGIILTSAYTTLQSRMSFRLFSILNLASVTLFTLALWSLLILFRTPVITFLVFIMLGPLNILALLGFWGTAGRLFTLRQGKRLFGLVDAGLLVGIIISCYAIPVLLSFNFESHNILLLSMGAVLAGCLFQILIGAKYRLSAEKEDTAPVHEKPEARKSLFQVFRTDPYIRVMGLFIALSVMTAFFVQYSFMAVTREQYPSEEDMARFLGLFTGSMMIFTFLVKILVFSYLIRNYGLRTCLALSPVLVSAFTIGAILLGVLMGYTPETSGFLLFFMLLALSRLFSKALKDSIESPSFKVIYQTIDEGDRFRIQSGMDGTVNEISALSSGLLLAGLGLLSFVKLIHFSFVLLLLTVLWVILAFRLYSWYRKSIRKALEPGGETIESAAAAGGLKSMQNCVSAKIDFNNNYFRLITGNNVSEGRNYSQNFINLLVAHAEREKDHSLIPLLKRIASDQATGRDLRMRAADVAESLEINAASGATTAEKGSGALAMISGERQPQTSQVLRLLRNKSLSQRRVALMIIGKYRMKELIAEVCECLGIQGLDVYARSILASFGPEAAVELSRFYMASSGNTAVSRNILDLLSAARTTETSELLFSGLWSGTRDLRETALRALLKINFKPSDDERDRLHQLISDIIGILSWNIAAKIVLLKNGNEKLAEALAKDNKRWEDFLFGILAITYDVSSITRIRENLSKGTVESVNFALEMVDIVVDDSVKPRLVPVIDMISDEEKHRTLYQFYPSELPVYDQLLINILNRDYNLEGIWIRACGLHGIDKLDPEELTDTVVSLLFSPSALLREEAARLLARSGREIYESVSARIPEGVKKHTDMVMAGQQDPSSFLYEKVSFLGSVFPEAGEEVLLWLADNLRHVMAGAINDEAGKGNCIIWSAETAEQDSTVWIAGDKTCDPEPATIEAGAGSFYLLPFEAIERADFIFQEKTGDLLEYIEQNTKP